ncbi:hypothetical protein [Glaciecola sp. 1036]|uniref:hypothetical protein n=1 Tax=Alteromonadaceae TaxID=72275 RepID=UPI003D054D25
MKFKKHIKQAAVVIGAVLLSIPSQAAVIDVLWVGGSTSYNANITELANEAATFDPNSDGNNTWNLTLWDNSVMPTPDFSAYDVLVIGSYLTGSFNMGQTPDGVLANRAQIENARGSRTLITGQDADWHDLNNRPDQDDGPKGFLINAVNWAASGTGLGVVAMPDQINSAGWWMDPESFLRNELMGNVNYFNTNGVFLGAGQETFPINEGLSSAGLSNWNTSSHVIFDDIDGYVGINFEGPNSTGRAITIVTEGQEDGGTTVNASNPSATLLIGLGITGLFMRRKRN